MRLQASRLPLPISSSPAASVSSLLYEPSSRSLALMLDDLSAFLYPSLTPTRFPGPSHTAVPPPSTAACFLRLLPSSRILFLAASPLAAGSSLQLRVWILLSHGGSGTAFNPARLDFRNDRGRFAVAFSLRHGHTIRLAGSVNAFVIHSVAVNQIWVFSAKLAAGEEETVHLMKCAVVELTLPIYSIKLSMGFMLLGEVDGIRVFPLRPLIKGQLLKSRVSAVKKASASIGDLCKKNLPNIIKSSLVPEESGIHCGCEHSGKNSAIEEKGDKPKTVRVRQDSGDLYSFFVFIKPAELQSCKGSKSNPASLKAVCIHVLSEKKYLILDSAGGLHFLNFNESGMALEFNAKSSMPFKDAHAYQLEKFMEVQLLAVLPDISSKTQYSWLSDGEYSIHLISMEDADVDADAGVIDKDGSKQKSTVVSVMGAIFTSEKVQDLVPISSNLCLVLCPGSMFIYGVA
ncbi:uncharacterized protein LOC121972181 [Zingiber officinale]|uniref:uncharacterized protein LOC121972181 n=1 Tax=Zingiber officinale TaxID=94328 RepID=UPI001C4C1D18|nr:uncharacterized protein LOC121972181 [Zingiber officinale]